MQSPVGPSAPGPSRSRLPVLLTGVWCQISNPLTHDWNKIEMQYCDGNSYAGNQQTVSRVSFGGRDNLPLYFRGKRNIEAVVSYLKEHHDLESATHFVLSGDSAGGIASYWHADYFQSVLPKAKVLSVPDSGFFISSATSFAAMSGSSDNSSPLQNAKAA